MSDDEKPSDGMIGLTIIPAHKKIIKRAAKLNGENMSSYIRRVALAEARRVLAEKGGEGPSHD